MTRKTGKELMAELADSAQFSELRNLLALAVLLRDAIYPASPLVPGLAEVIKLTSRGEQCKQALQAQFPDLGDEELTHVLFAYFAHHSPLVDTAGSDISGVAQVLSRAVQRRQVLFPFIYFRTLYELAHDTLEDVPARLPPSDTISLLAASPQGVFQIGNYITGPFGVLEGEHDRYLPPTRSAGLSHCTDPACGRAHIVALESTTSTVTEAFAWLGELLTKAAGWADDWDDFLWRAVGETERWHSDFSARGISAALGNAFSESELCVLLKQVLREHPALRLPLRQLEKATGEKFRGSEQELSAGLSRAEILQLLLLASDELLAASIDKAVGTGDILVPATEVRQAEQRPTAFLGQRPEVSSLGIRFVGDKELPPSRLRRLIEILGTSEGSPEDLEWHLMDVGGTDLQRKLTTVVFESDPAELVEAFAIRGRREYETTVDYLRYGYFPRPTSSDAKRILVQRILWKLGFNVTVHPPLHATFDRLGPALAEVVMRRGVDTHGAQQDVRSVAVNYFVCLEEILEDALIFTLWSLMNDHYAQTRRTRFRYNRSSSLLYASSFLNGRRLTATQSLTFSASGGNTLFPLVEGLRHAGHILDDCLTGGNTGLRRSDALPTFHALSGVMRVPFTFRHPILDVDDAAAQELLQAVEAVPRRLNGANTLGVRNRVPHAGREFPTPDELLAVVDAATEAVENLRSAGLVPLVRYPAGSQSDQYQREQIVLEDYQGREWKMFLTKELRGAGMPPPTDPQVVLSAARLREADDVLRFWVEEESEYVRMWRGYPRGFLPPSSDGVEDTAYNTASHERALTEPG